LLENQEQNNWFSSSHSFLNQWKQIWAVFGPVTI
jgi:hypothetical protein